MTKEQLLELSNKCLLGGAKVYRSVYQSLIAEYEKIEKAKRKYCCRIHQKYQKQVLFTTKLERR